MGSRLVYIIKREWCTVVYAYKLILRNIIFDLTKLFTPAVAVHTLTFGCFSALFWCYPYVFGWGICLEAYFGSLVYFVGLFHDGNECQTVYCKKRGSVEKNMRCKSKEK